MFLPTLKFQKLDQRKGAGQLFKTTLEKALFSSPAACLSTIKNRLARLEKNPDQDDLRDISSLVGCIPCTNRLASPIPFIPRSEWSA